MKDSPETEGEVGGMEGGVLIVAAVVCEAGKGGAMGGGQEAVLGCALYISTGDHAPSLEAK